MGGYALTEMNEYEMNDALALYFRQLTGKELVPVKVLFTIDSIEKPGHGPLRGIALYEGASHNFIRLHGEQATQVWARTDISKSQAVIRESHYMTVVRSKTLRIGTVYEPF